MQPPSLTGVGMTQQSLHDDWPGGAGTRMGCPVRGEFLQGLCEVLQGVIPLTFHLTPSLRVVVSSPVAYLTAGVGREDQVQITRWWRGQGGCLSASHPCPGDTHGQGLGMASLEVALNGEVSTSPLAWAHTRFKPHGPLGRLCIPGPTAMSMRGPRGEAHLPQGSPSFSNVASGKTDGRVQSA